MKRSTSNRPAERWLFKAFFIAAILASGCTDAKHPAPTREAAVRVLKHNGTVIIRVGAETRTIRQMRDLPLKGFAIVGINLNRRKEFGDDDLQAFKHLITLRRLSLKGTSVSDDSSNVYSTLKNLEFIDISDTAITDKSIEKIAELSQLKELLLADTEITKQGLSQIANLLSLQFLDLTATSIAPADLEQLVGLYNLLQIRMIGADSTDFPAKLFRKSIPLCKFVSIKELP